MKSTHVLSAITLLLWLLLVFLGFSAIDQVRFQHVTGFPSSQQMYYYLYIPIAVLVAVAFSWAITQKGKSFRRPALTFIAFSLLSFFPYFLFFTGGI